MTYNLTIDSKDIGVLRTALARYKRDLQNNIIDTQPIHSTVKAAMARIDRIHEKIEWIRCERKP